jgi:hypothetical protein
MAKAKKIAAFTPYYTEEQAEQVRAAFVNAGQPEEGDASVSDFIVRASMREAKRLQRKYNGGKPWPAVKSGELRRGQRTMDEMQHRNEEP